MTENQLEQCSEPITWRSVPTPPHTLYDDYNRKNHDKTDGVINDGILDNLEAIKVYDIEIKYEEELAKEISRIGNLSMALGYKLEDEDRLLSRKEAYQQVSHSASFLKAVLRYVEGWKGLD